MATELSPPKNTAETLDNLSATTGALIDAFDQIITLPFVDSLRIDALGELSIADVVLDLKQKYQELQGNTLPFARTLYAYAGLQLQTIPTINAGLDLSTYLNLHKLIIARHKLEASNVKKQSETFRKTFVATLDVFESTIKELGEQIQDLEKQIQDTKDLQEKERAVAIIAGIFTFIFTVVAILAIVATAGAVGPAASSATSTIAVQGSASVGFFTALGSSIGAAAGTSGLIAVSAAASTAALGGLAETIVSSIEARNFARAVSALETLKESAETARDHLLEVVNLMTVIENSLEDIVSVWTDVESSLSIIQSDVDNWNDENFSEELVASTLEEWEDVRTAVAKYTAVVSGDRSLNLEKQSDVHLPADEIINLTRSFAISELQSNLHAPDIEFEGKLSDLCQMRSALETTKSLPNIRDTLKSQVTAALGHFGEVQTGLEQSSDELASFTKQRLAWLDAFEIAEVTKRIDMVAQLEAAVENFEVGIARAQETEAKAFLFQTSVGLVISTLIRIINENNVKQHALKKELEKLEKDRKRRKWLWVVPVAGAVNEIVDAANNIRGKIKRGRREIRLISNSCQQLRKLSSTVSSSVKDSTLVTQTYSSILNDTRAGIDDAAIFKVFGAALPADLFVSLKESWTELEIDIKEFKE